MLLFLYSNVCVVPRRRIIIYTTMLVSSINEIHVFIIRYRGKASGNVFNGNWQQTLFGHPAEC